MSLNKLFSWSDIEDDVRMFALSQGITARRPSKEYGCIYQNLPVTLFPSEIDKYSYNTALEMQQPLNQMINKISLDHAFLESGLEELVKVDSFAGNLFDIYKKVYKEGFAANHSLGIFRSDYIIDNNRKLKQVEINTISVSFAGLAPSIAQFHKYALKNYRLLNEATIDQFLPKNSSLDDIAQALVDAHSIYNKSDAAILVVIEENVANIMDQKLIEWKAKSKWNNIRIYRRSFREMDGFITLGPNKELLLTVKTHLFTEEKVEISVVYFRTAYTTNDFLYENSWSLRLLIERSSAIKCPSIPFQLAGIKKFQTLLCNRSIFDRYIEASEDVAKKVYNTFVKFWNVNDESLKLVAQSPENFVLKPNLEGGGNNYFGQEIVAKMKESCELNQTEAYFLMEYINQPSVKNYIIRPESNDSASHGKGSSLIKNELGIFGTILSSKDGLVVFNRNAGHLLRSKLADTNEAGIMSGGGVLDSPFLVTNY